MVAIRLARKLRARITNPGPPLPEKVVAQITLSDAFDYAHVAKSCPIDRYKTAPIYQMLGHAIELSLKAFLLWSSYSPRKCRALNHNLEKAMALAVDEGLNVDPEDISTVSFLNQSYNAPYAFRYYNHDGWAAPDLESVFACCDRLLSLIKQRTS